MHSYVSACAQCTYASCGQACKHTTQTHMHLHQHQTVFYAHKVYITFMLTLQIAREWLGDYLDQDLCTCALDINTWPRPHTSHPAMIAIVRGILAPKRAAGLDQIEISYICQLVADSFTQSADNSCVPLRILPITGGPVSASELVRGLVLLERMYVPPAAEHLCTSSRKGSLRLILYATSLERSSADTEEASCANIDKQAVSDTSQIHTDSINTSAHKTCHGENRYLANSDGETQIPDDTRNVEHQRQSLKYFSAWLRMHTDIVGCQQGIDEDLKAELLHAGVLPLERLSQANIQV
jgi:hypothetical protein